MSKLALVTFKIYLDEFSFLGFEHVVTENSDFGKFWDVFFKNGGYKKITPKAIPPKLDTNVWHTNDKGEKIYFQGKIVGNVKNAPENHSYKTFPACEYLVVTHEWLPTFKEAQKYGIDAGWENMKTVPMPEGYVKDDGITTPITVIERDNKNTPDGSRIEFWVPIRKKK